jgi:hypothetical protein
MATVLLDFETSIPTAIMGIPPFVEYLTGSSSSESIHIRWLNGSIYMSQLAESNSRK